ncbi:MAG: hypothetical protein HY537_08145 [Deltaproteobacteria bacterium]|nr:hypothetical protein [Deltaproteobacteria bacterium]
MKLYEFTYTDNQKLSNAALNNRVEEFLQEESDLQGWAPGYTFRQCKDAHEIGPNEKNYFFEVLGSYLDADTLSSDDKVVSSGTGSDSVAAREANP